MSFNNSTNMGLPVPQVGLEPGPAYATDINNCMAIIDQHNHSSGSGVPITPAGMSISSDLSFLNNNLTNARSLRLQIQPSPLSGAADLTALYASGVDLYFNDGLGNQIQITSGGGVAGTSGSITGLVSPASASYVAISQTFVWQSNVNTAASLDARNVILRNATASSSGLTLSPPSAMGSDYTITLPSLPVSLSLVSMDNTGAQGTVAPDGSTIVISGGSLSIPSNVPLPGDLVTIGGRYPIVANTNPAAPLCIIRGVVKASLITSGEGFTVTNPSAGEYNITFTTPFADIPAITATAWDPPFNIATVEGSGAVTTASATRIVIYSVNTMSQTDGAFSFIAIGQRA